MANCYELLQYALMGRDNESRFRFCIENKRSTHSIKSWSKKLLPLACVIDTTNNIDDYIFFVE